MNSTNYYDEHTYDDSASGDYGSGNLNTLAESNISFQENGSENYYVIDYDYYDDAGKEKDSVSAGNVFLIIVFIFGLVGNLFNIFGILLLKEYKKSTLHLYVLQVSIADAMFLLIIPFNVSEAMNDKWIFGKNFCKAKEAVLYLNYYASIMFLVVMSIDRYIAVCHSFNNTFQKLRKFRTCLIISVTVWTISLLCCIPMVRYATMVGNEPDCNCEYKFPECKNITDTSYSCITEHQDNYCLPPISEKEVSYYFAKYGNEGHLDYSYNNTFDNADENYESGEDALVKSSSSTCKHANSPAWKTFNLVNFLIFFIVPMLVMTFTYAQVVLHVKKSTNKALKKSRSNIKAKGGKKKMSANRRVTIMCSVLVISFIFLWLPFQSISLAKIRGIAVSQKTCDGLMSWAIIFAFLNSASNPYLYNFLTQNFVDRFRKIFRFSSTLSVTNTSSATQRTRVKYQKSRAVSDSAKVSIAQSSSSSKRLNSSADESSAAAH